MARKLLATLVLINRENSILEELAKDEEGSLGANWIAEQDGLPLQYATNSSCGSRGGGASLGPVVVMGIAGLGAALSTTGDICRGDSLNTTMSWDAVNPSLSVQGNRFSFFPLF